MGNNQWDPTMFKKKKKKPKQNQCMIACKNDKSYSLVFFFKPEMYFD